LLYRNFELLRDKESLVMSLIGFSFSAAFLFSSYYLLLLWAKFGMKPSTP
jgi:hypothetical protein